MSTHNNSPAELIQYLMVAEGVGTLPTERGGNEWVIYTGHLPEDPDTAIAVYDTEGIRDGRIQRSGENIDHEGWQVRVRGPSYPIAYAKIKEIKDFLASVVRESVVVSEDSYTIHNITRTGTILSLGQEIGPKRRDEFTINGILTFTEDIA